MPNPKTNPAIAAIKKKVQQLHRDSDKLIKFLDDSGMVLGEPIYPSPPGITVAVGRRNTGYGGYREPAPPPPKEPEIPTAPLPLSFPQQYQVWYTGCRTLVAANMPDRLDELVATHEERMAQVIRRERLLRYEQIGAVRYIALTQAIVDAIPKHLEMQLHNIDLLLSQSYVRDQLSEARVLLDAGYTRSAGALAGVLLERHLKLLCDSHQPKIVYNPREGIDGLNKLLQGRSVYDKAQQARVELMRQVRNKCDHANTTEPQQFEVEGLIKDVADFVVRFSV
jgi:hypothetical protein